MVLALRRCLFAIGPGLGLFGIILILGTEINWGLSDEGWGIASAVVGFVVAFFMVAIVERGEVLAHLEREISVGDWVLSVVVAFALVMLSLVAATR